jgi:hypothetical protein
MGTVTSLAQGASVEQAFLGGLVSLGAGLIGGGIGIGTSGLDKAAQIVVGYASSVGISYATAAATGTLNDETWDDILLSSSIGFAVSSAGSAVGAEIQDNGVAPAEGGGGTGAGTVQSGESFDDFIAGLPGESAAGWDASLGSGNAGMGASGGGGTGRALLGPFDTGAGGSYAATQNTSADIYKSPQQTINTLGGGRNPSRGLSESAYINEAKRVIDAAYAEWIDQRSAEYKRHPWLNNLDSFRGDDSAPVCVEYSESAAIHINKALKDKGIDSITARAESYANTQERHTGVRPTGIMGFLGNTHTRVVVTFDNSSTGNQIDFATYDPWWKSWVK